MNKGNKVKMFETINRILVQEPKTLEAKPKTQENPLAVIQRDYILLGYYSGVIPYKPVFNLEKCCWSLKTGKYQKFVCTIVWAILWFLIITEYLGYFIGILRASKSLTPKSYFSLVNNMVSCWVVLMFFRILKNHKEKLENCINQSSELLYINNKCVQWVKNCLYFNYFCLFCFIVLPLPFHSDFFVGEVKSPKEAFQEHYIKNGRQRFFIDGNSTEFTASNIVVGGIEFLCILCWSLVYWLQNALIAATLPATIWLAGKNFEVFTENINFNAKVVGGNTIKEVEEKYETLKRFCGLINGVWSTITLVWIFDTVIRVVMILNELISSRSIFNLLSVIVWMGNIVVLFTLSGETYRKMEHFKAQLLEERNFETFYRQDKLVLKRLLRDLDGAPVGIGATGMYKLNYGFVAQLITAATTIFLVSFEKE